MGRNQNQISVDKPYISLLEHIADADRLYKSSKSDVACKKRVVQDAIKLMYLLKTKRIECISLFVCKGCHRKEDIDKVIELLSGKNDEKRILESWPGGYE